MNKIFYCLAMSEGDAKDGWPQHDFLRNLEEEVEANPHLIEYGYKKYKVSFDIEEIENA